jgi:formylmethanofuran dehydrogenase subunit D
MMLLLNTGSTIEQGVVIKGGRKMTEEYRKEAANCHLNPEDFKKLWDEHGMELKKVKVSTKDASVVLSAISDDRVEEGQAFIPRGPWANIIISEYTFDSGSPYYKGMYVEIQPTDEEVLECNELIEKTFKKKRL